MYVLSLHTPASAMKPPCKGSKENVDSAINNTSIHDLPKEREKEKVRVSFYKASEYPHHSNP